MFALGSLPVAPRIVTFARAKLESLLPVLMVLAPGELDVDVPLNETPKCGVYSLHLMLTTPPGDGLHVSKPVLGSKVQVEFVNNEGARVLVSMKSESVLPCTSNALLGIVPEPTRDSRVTSVLVSRVKMS